MEMILVFIVKLYFISFIIAHSNLRYPTPRGNIKFSSYCSKGLGCNGPCESSREESSFIKPFYPKKIIKRGEKIKVEWLRQNHPGGFVRLAFVPFDRSDDPIAFDSNVIKYACYESNCGERVPDSFLGYLNGKGDDPCSTYVTVPDNLPDGPVTMQWIWFGGGIYFAVQDTSFANYYNCADMEVFGGNPYQPEVKPKAVFQGGDIANPNSNLCRYWARNKADDCPEGSENGAECGKAPPKNGIPSHHDLVIETSA